MRRTWVPYWDYTLAMKISRFGSTDRGNVYRGVAALFINTIPYPRVGREFR